MTKLTGSSYAKIALALALGVLLIGFAFGGARSCSPSYGFVANGSNKGSASVNAAEVKNLSIEWAAGAVQVKVVDDAQAGDAIVFTETSDRGLTKNQEMRWSMSGNTLAIDYGNVFSCMSLARKNLEVRIPQKYASAFDTISLDSASGSYDLQGFGCDTLVIGHASGTIEGSDLTANTLNIDVASGQLNLEGSFSQRIITQLASGRVAVTSDICPTAIDADLASGRTTVNIPENEGFSVRVDKASGSFSSAFPTTQQENNHVYGNGSAQFDVDIASGEFALGRTN